MRNLVLYTLLGTVLGAIADAMGASMPVSFMAALIGPPLLHFGWLAFNGRGGW